MHLADSGKSSSPRLMFLVYPVSADLSTLFFPVLPGPAPGILPPTIGVWWPAVAAFADVRDWQPVHSSESLSMSIAIEAAGLIERFQWLTTEEAQAAVEDAAEQAAVADKLADILI
jgi:hypothetical protein